MLSGPFLFLVGTALFRWVLERRWARAQIAGIVALPLLGLAAVAAVPLDVLTLSVVSAFVLVAVAIGETIGRLRRGRRSGG